MRENPALKNLICLILFLELLFENLFKIMFQNYKLEMNLIISLEKSEYNKDFSLHTLHKWLCKVPNYENFLSDALLFSFSFQEVEIETDAVKQAKQLEVEGVAQAEAGHTDRALELFSEAIHIAPEHSSSFNNRAQALRLQGDTQGIPQSLYIS